MADGLSSVESDVLHLVTRHPGVQGSTGNTERAAAIASLVKRGLVVEKNGALHPSGRETIRAVLNGTTPKRGASK